MKYRELIDLWSEGKQLQVIKYITNAKLTNQERDNLFRKIKLAAFLRDYPIQHLPITPALQIAYDEYWTEHFILGSTPNLTLWALEDDTYQNIDKAITVVHIPSKGGVIVNLPEDLILSITADFIKYQLSTADLTILVSECLSQKLDNLVVTNNDILYQDKKIVGITSAFNKQKRTIRMHFSIGDANSLIEKYCVTPAHYYAGQIPLTTDELYTLLYNYFQNIINEEEVLP